MNAAPLTEREVAEALTVSPRTIRRHAEELGAVRVGPPALNGKVARRYDPARIPVDAALNWASQQKTKVVDIQSAAPGQLALPLLIPQGPNLSEEDRAEAEARLQVIEPLITPQKFSGLWAQCHGRRGELIDLLAREHKTAPRTIRRWVAQWNSGGIERLVSRDRSDKGRPRVITPAALEWLAKAAFPERGSYGTWTVAEIYRAYNEERIWRAAHVGKPMGAFEQGKYSRYLDANGGLEATALLPECSYETLRSWYEKIPEALKTMARDGIEVFANTQEVLSFRDLAAVKPLDYVVMDHRRLDLFCLIPERGGWKLARPWLTAAIDMRTRKWLAWAIVESPSSDSIATVLKRVFLDCGLPSRLYWDNGKDFTCDWFEKKRAQTRQADRIGEMPAAWRGVLETLGVRVTHAIKYRARAKIIEPNFVRTSDFDRSTPWWCGHKPGARPKRFEALLEQHEQWLAGHGEAAFPTIRQVAKIYSDLLADELNERELQGEAMQKVTPRGRGWMCPNEAWEILIRDVELKSVPAEVLQFCFAKRKTVTVKHAEVHSTFGGYDYHWRLSDPRNLMALNGQQVEFAYDPGDLGTVALYYQDRFLGLAENVELRRMGEQDFVQDERDRRRQRRDIKDAIEDVHRTVPMAGVIERQARRAEVRPSRIEPSRTVSPALLPAAIVEAAQAKAADDSFSFSAVDAALPVAGAAEAPVDDNFEFFGGTNANSSNCSA